MKDSTREMQDFINYVCSIYEKNKKEEAKLLANRTS
jgi:hypothetical protein